MSGDDLSIIYTSLCPFVYDMHLDCCRLLAQVRRSRHHYMTICCPTFPSPGQLSAFPIILRIHYLAPSANLSANRI